jgi:hypothetical protein
MDINLEKNENKVSKEIAIKEVQKFIRDEADLDKKDHEIESDYPQIIRAVELGLLIFENGKPKFTLKNPIKNDEGDIALGEITFRSRIKPTQLAEIMKGVDLTKNQLEYSLRAHAYLIGQPKAMLDKFSKFDYRVIDQISTVFL